MKEMGVLQKRAYRNLFCNSPIFRIVIVVNYTEIVLKYIEVCVNGGKTYEME